MRFGLTAGNFAFLNTDKSKSNHKETNWLIYRGRSSWLVNGIPPSQVCEGRRG